MKTRKYFEQHRLSVIVGMVMTAALVIGLAIVIPLGLRGGSPATTQTPTPTTGVATPAVSPATTPTPAASPGDNTPAPVQGVVWGPQACPAGIGDPAHWNAILGTRGTNSKVEGVSCANVLGNPSIQAVVTVRHSDANSTLDVYVFTHITSAKPTQLFKLQGLLKGDARISGYNTVMTAEVDPNSSANAGKPVAQWTRDLFKEFEWNAGKGTLAQVAFPGIFPDLTRYQAETDQSRVNQGKDTWKNDAKQVAKNLGAKFFGWTLPSTVTLISGGGAKDIYATVKVVENGPGTKPPTITLTLTRLEGNTHNMWVVIGVESGSGVLTSVGSRSLVASPVKLEGKGSAFEGDIGEAYILDHLYAVVGHAHLTGIPGLGMGVSPYVVQVSYDIAFKQGPQEGVVEVQLTNPIGIGPNATVMVKVLLDPQPRVALGPVSCPLKTGSPAYWEPILGLDTTKFSIGTIACANMKGNPSLQAVIPVYHTDSSQIIDVYVYDQITSAHPVQLFKVDNLLRGGAMISGYSTLLTAQVDLKSSINKGKSGDQLTMDLYREFQWDGKAGSFVQVVFPGMYPDLTRWQAEVAQYKVMLQQDTWKLDVMKTVEHFVAQFLPSAPTDPPARLQLVSGGGAHDLTAQVNAAFPNGTQLGPATRITLKRLEGNVNGVWEVTAVQADWMYISSPQSGPTTRVSNSVTVTGFGRQFESQVGTVYIVDHLYTKIGTAFAMGYAGFGSGPFTVNVPYVSSYQGGAQEGIVELVHTGGASFDYGVVFVKVLVNP